MPAPVTEALTSRDAFLEALRATGILTSNQLTKAKALAPAGTAADAARALVAAGLLTRFQADRLLIGRTDGFTLGPYVILEQVGRGSMSRVYKAKHRTMNRPVAIKVLASNLTRTAADREWFQKEVRAAGKLAHPNVVTAYDANELYGRFYLVLEFVDGPTLDTFIRQRGPLTVAEACEFVRQTATGLQHAHEKGMVHRDLKPQNLLVARPTPSAPLTVKIADFGIPKSVHAPTYFTAPEQVSSPTIPADSRADLYSLGCVFYFLLTGRPPGEHPVPIGQIRPDVSPEVAGILHRLLAKPPAARLASAAELLIALDAACVPVAPPVDDAVNFDMPAYSAPPGHDSGFLTGRAAQPSGLLPRPGSGTFPVPEGAPSPWAQLTDEIAEETQQLGLDDTPLPPPQKLKPPGHGEPVPLWMSAFLLVGIVLLCLMGIGVVLRLMVK
jgi:serine/threonine-protein kinase